MKKLRKASYVIFLIALGCIAILVAAPLLPIPGNYEIRVVRSGSMEPSIQTGSVVFTRAAAEYNVGDVITFNTQSMQGANNIPVTHRIMEVKQEGARTTYVTKGDANDASDQSEVRAQDILGKVLFDLPYLGYAVETARTPYGFLALILVPALLIIGEEIGKIGREVKRMRSKHEDAATYVPTEEHR